MREKIERLKACNMFRYVKAEERAALLHLAHLEGQVVDVRGESVHFSGYAEGFLDGIEFFLGLGRDQLCGGCVHFQEKGRSFEETCPSCMRYHRDRYRLSTKEG